MLTTKPTYIAALALPIGSADVIDDYRKLRNQIHLPGDLLRARNVDKLGDNIGTYLADFVNDEIIKMANTLISAHNAFNRRPVEDV